MSKAIVVYESKYGNTKTVAEEIFQGIQDAGVDTFLAELSEIDINRVAEFDTIIIGTPNHMGGSTRSIRKFIDSLGKANPEGKVTLFDTYLGQDFEKAIKKMEKRIGEKASGLKLILNGLSIRVEGAKGPIAEGELPKCREFGRKIASLIS